MKGIILLADAAVGHSDGTMSILRGGISSLTVPIGEPIAFRGGIWVALFGEAGDVEGVKKCSLHCVDESGTAIGLPDMNFDARVPNANATAFVVVAINIVLPRPGKYEIVVTIENTVLRQSLEGKEISV